MGTILMVEDSRLLQIQNTWCPRPTECCQVLKTNPLRCELPAQLEVAEFLRVEHHLTGIVYQPRTDLDAHARLFTLQSEQRMISATPAIA